MDGVKGYDDQVGVGKVIKASGLQRGKIFMIMTSKPLVSSPDHTLYASSERGSGSN